MKVQSECNDLCESGELVAAGDDAGGWVQDDDVGVGDAAPLLRSRTC